MTKHDYRWCKICNPKNRTLYWHLDKDTGQVWVYCNKCERGYSLDSYCHIAGISPNDIISNQTEFEADTPNEVQTMEWPHRFLNMSDPRSKEGVEYVQSRGLTLEGDLYYDSERNGIVFPYYFEKHFVGAQTRLIVPWIDADGKEQKIDTMPSTRLGLLLYGWNQSLFTTNIKRVIVTEGAFNTLSIQQSLNSLYGGILNNPWKCVATSGSGVSSHHIEVFKELQQNGIKIVAAPDSDIAGNGMLSKMVSNNVANYRLLTQDSDKDFNDLLKEMGHKEFARWIISNVKKI